MKSEKFWDGFLLGFFIGGVIALVIYDLIVQGIL
jgi:hypothetical protein